MCCIDFVRPSVIVCLIVSAIGCAAPAQDRVSTLPAAKVSHPIQVLAIAPNGRSLANAVGVELSKHGFTIVNAATTSNLIARLNISEADVALPAGFAILLAKLNEQGIDAYITVLASGEERQKPQSASVRVNSTHSGKVIASVSWKNERRGVNIFTALGAALNPETGQPALQRQAQRADELRKGLVDAAIEISDALLPYISVHQ